MSEPGELTDAAASPSLRDEPTSLPPSGETPAGLPVLSDDVRSNIRRLVPRGADRLFTHLATAAALLQLHVPAQHLRLAESVAYNIRETLDSVAHAADAGVGGLGAVHDAWSAVEAAREVGDDDTAAVNHLLAVVKATADAKDRENFRARQLVTQIRNATGVEPFHASGSIVARYNTLRQRAAGSLHSAMTMTDADTLYRDTVAWLTWMFTPPEQRAADIAALAAQPYSDPIQLNQLRDLCSNPLQLGRFLALITDPGWLRPLYDSGIIALPNTQDPAPWPAQQLTLTAAHPDAVGQLLHWLADDVRNLPQPQRPAAAFTLLRECVDGGADALDGANKLLSKYGPNYPGIRRLGIDLARRCDPQHPFVERAARLALLPEDVRRHHHAEPVLRALAAGLTPANAQARVKLLAHALKNLHDANPYLVMDLVPLTADPGRTSDERRRTAHHLLRLCDAARSHGATTTELLSWTSPLQASLGQRVTSALLTDAGDINPETKIAHIATRLQDDPTGDDRNLICSVLNDTKPAVTKAAIAEWTAALGDPPAYEEPVNPNEPGTAEATVWRWAALLPAECTNAWDTAIAPIVAEHGHPDPGRFDMAREDITWRFPGDASPITVDQLADLTGPDAAARVSAWQSDPEDQNPDASRHALAQAFEQATELRLTDWLPHADAITNTLTDPLMITRFLRAATQSGSTLPAAAEALTNALIIVASTTWADYAEADRTSLTNNVLDLAAHLANHRSVTIAEPAFSHLWRYAAATALTTTDTYTPIGDILDDVTGLTAAINEPAGRATLAVLALAANHYRATSATPPELTSFLDHARDLTGATKPYIDAVLLAHFALINTLAPAWLDENTSTLIPEGPTGDDAAYAIISRNHPTSALLTRLHDRVHSLVKKHPERSVYWLLTGALHSHPGYSVTDAINTISDNMPAAEELCQQIAFLVQDHPDDSPFLAAAITGWRTILTSTLPRQALPKLGHWAFVNNIHAAEYIPLMNDTLTITGGIIDHPTDVADRWTISEAADSITIHNLLLGHGEPWEQTLVATTALNCLKAATTRPLTPQQRDTFATLRAALIDRGHYDAEEITAPT